MTLTFEYYQYTDLGGWWITLAIHYPDTDTGLDALDTLRQAKHIRDIRITTEAIKWDSVTSHSESVSSSHSPSHSQPAPTDSETTAELSADSSNHPT